MRSLSIILLFLPILLHSFVQLVSSSCSSTGRGESIDAHANILFSYKKISCLSYVNTSLPSWIEETSTHLLGVPLESDVTNTSSDIKDTPNYITLPCSIPAQVNSSCKNNLSKSDTLKIRVLPLRRGIPTSAPLTSTLGPQAKPLTTTSPQIPLSVDGEDGHLGFQVSLTGCRRRWPTAAALVLDVDLASMSPQERVSLIQNLTVILSGPNKSQRSPTVRLYQNVDSFVRSHFILASGPGNGKGYNVNVFPDTSTQDTQGAIAAWYIGCGAITQHHLRQLERLEKTAVTGDLSRSLGGYSVHMWFVGDEKPANYVNTPPGSLSTPSQSSAKYHRVRRQASFTNNYWAPSSGGIGGVLYDANRYEQAMHDMNDGSGLYPQPPVVIESPRPSLPMSNMTTDEDNDIVNQTTSITANISTNQPTVMQPTLPIPRATGLPIVKSSMAPVTVYGDDLMTVTVPMDTFFDPEDSPSNSLVLKLYKPIPPTEDITSSPSRQPRVPEVLPSELEPGNDWVAFVPSIRQIKIKPFSINHLGQHKYTLCAFDRDNNEICEPVVINVKKPQTVLKNITLSASAGRLWEYEMPIRWFKELNSQSVDQLDIQGKGSVPYTLTKSGLLQVVTDLSTSKQFEYLTFNVSTASKLREMYLRVTLVLMKPPTPANQVVSSNLYRMRLTKDQYGLSDIAFLLKTMASLLTPNATMATVKANDLVIVQLRQCKPYMIGTEDTKWLEFDWIYQPIQSGLSCSDTRLIGVPTLLSAQQSFPEQFRVENITEISHGSCKHPIDGADYEKPLTTPQPTSRVVTSAPTFVPTTIQVTPSIDNLILDFTVTAGLAFNKKTEKRPADQPKILSMELLDQNNRAIENHFWIQLSSNHLSVYGFPLWSHVRTLAYVFKIRATLEGSIIAETSFRVTVIADTYKTKSNHEVTMRFRYPPNQLTSSVLGSIQLRKLIVKILDGYVSEESCTPNCGHDIGVFSLQDTEPASDSYNTRVSDTFYVQWFKLSLFRDYTDNSPCPRFKERRLKSYLLVSTSPSVKQPNDTLVKFFKTKSEGKLTLEEVSFKPLGACALPEIPRNVVDDYIFYQGHPFRESIFPELAIDGKSAESVSLCYQNGECIDPSNWIQVSKDNKYIYGLPTATDAKRHPYNFTLKIFTKTSSVDVPFSVMVHSLAYGDRPEPNHLVTLQLRLLHGQVTSSVLAALKLRWNVVEALDRYMRPNCEPKCGSDIVLYQIVATDTQEEFSVEWAQKSLFDSAASSSILPRPSPQRRVRRSASESIVRRPCPQEGIQQLQRFLIGDRGGGPQPLPAFVDFLVQARVGRVIKVKLERLGACKVPNVLPGPTDDSKRPGTGGSSIPGVSGGDTTGGRGYPPANRDDLDESQRTFLLTTVIPACALIILALLIALLVACCLHKQQCSICAPKRPPTYKDYEFQNKGVPVIFAEELEDRASPPSRPLILPNEKPPLPPPNYSEDERIPLTATSTMHAGNSNGNPGSITHDPYLHHQMQPVHPSGGYGPEPPIMHGQGGGNYNGHLQQHQFNHHPVSPHIMHMATHSPHMNMAHQHQQFNQYHNPHMQY